VGFFFFFFCGVVVCLCLWGVSMFVVVGEVSLTADFVVFVFVFVCVVSVCVCARLPLFVCVSPNLEEQIGKDSSSYFC